MSNTSSSVPIHRMRGQNFYRPNKALVWLREKDFPGFPVDVCLPYLRYGNEYLPLKPQSVSFNNRDMSDMFGDR